VVERVLRLCELALVQLPAFLIGARYAGVFAEPVSGSPLCCLCCTQRSTMLGDQAEPLGIDFGREKSQAWLFLTNAFMSRR
jgi:hypothetical protein